MAKVWDYEGSSGWPIVVEDPRTGNDGFYIDGVKHDKTSLTPQFNRKLNYQYNTTSPYLTRHNNNSSTSAHSNGQSLALAKLQSACSIASTNTADDYNWVDPSSWIDMSGGEGGYKGGVMQSLKSNDGNTEAVIHNWNSGTTAYCAAWPLMDITKDLDEQNPNARGNFSDNYSKVLHWWGKGYGTTETYQPSLSRGDDGTNFYNYASFRLRVGYNNSWPNSWVTNQPHTLTNMSNNTTPQFLGEASDGNLMFAASNEQNGVYVTKCAWTTSSTPTQTAMLAYNTAPSAGGSHQGGNNRNGLAYTSNMSEVFDDPRGTAGTNKMWYRSYYDSYHNYHPLVVTWDKSTDTFAVETDITTDVNSSTHADISGIASDTSTNVCMQFSCATWVSGGTRYVADFKVDGRYTQWDTDEAFRTWVIYSVDAANPKILTYHSKVLMPTTPRNWIWLNDSHTMIGVWFANQFLVYSWNDSTGWTLTTTISGQIHEVGRDSLDRIWYTKPSSVYGGYFPELHLLTPTLPVSITVTPENASYTYSGSNINSYINVSAVNASGARIATSVKLVIEGSSMTFSDSTTQKTVTTLSTGELQVNTIITGAGFTNIAASIEI